MRGSFVHSICCQQKLCCRSECDEKMLCLLDELKSMNVSKHVPVKPENGAMYFVFSLCVVCTCQSGNNNKPVVASTRFPFWRPGLKYYTSNYELLQRGLFLNPPTTTTGVRAIRHLRVSRYNLFPSLRASAPASNGPKNCACATARDEFFFSFLFLLATREQSRALLFSGLLSLSGQIDGKNFKAKLSKPH